MTPLTDEQVRAYLCWYDPRNPNYIKPDDDYDFREPRTERCWCDNCFYGKDRLAEEIIRLRESHMNAHVELFVLKDRLALYTKGKS